MRKNTKILLSTVALLGLVGCENQGQEPPQEAETVQTQDIDGENTATTEETPATNNAYGIDGFKEYIRNNPGKYYIEEMPVGATGSRMSQDMVALKEGDNFKAISAEAYINHYYAVITMDSPDNIQTVYDTTVDELKEMDTYSAQILSDTAGIPLEQKVTTTEDGNTTYIGTYPQGKEDASPVKVIQVTKVDGNTVIYAEYGPSADQNVLTIFENSGIPVFKF